jgi:hypothetical protein
MHADGWSVTGHSIPTLVRLASATREKIDLDVCIDVSEVELVDAAGASKVGADRPDVQRMLVTVVPSPSSGTQLAISEFNGREDGPTCD